MRHRRPESGVDVRVVRVDHRELAVGETDRCDRDDVGIVFPNVSRGVGRRIGVGARDARGPSALGEEVGNNHHVAGLQAIGLGVEQTAVAPRGGLLPGKLLVCVELRAEKTEVLRGEPSPALAKTALLELAEDEGRAIPVGANHDVATHSAGVSRLVGTTPGGSDRGLATPADGTQA
nr:hypothetical protein [Deltaproteobacteria bacterium]